MIFEGLAADEAEATAKLEAGEGISLAPCHDCTPSARWPG